MGYIEEIVKNILLKENQVVKKRDAIAYIDSSQLPTKKSQLVGNIQKNQQLAQLDAQILALDGQIAAENNRSARTFASAEADMNRTQRNYQDRKVIVTSDVQEAESNIKLLKMTSKSSSRSTISLSEC